MKELNIQEKAKAYDRALKVLHKYDGANIMFSQSLKEEMFPNLKESVDKKIRNEIIAFLKEGKPYHCPNSVKRQEWAVWLEKHTNTPNNIYDKELSEILGCVIRRYINDPNISYAEREKVSKEIIPYVESLEKQGEHSNFLNKIQIGDKVTRNKDGVLVNLSQLNRLAKPTNEEQKDILEDAILDGNEDGLIAETIRYKKERQDEQKSADRVEPKFHEGEWVIIPNNQIKQIKSISFGNYYFTDSSIYNIIDVDNKGHIWTIQDAKDGDVLVSTWKGCSYIYIFKEVENNIIMSHIFYYPKLDTIDMGIINMDNTPTIPATKEQRDTLFQKMKEARYTWDVDKKELKKIEQETAEYEKPLLEKFKQAVYDCAWGKVTCKKEGETKEEYANRWAEQFLLMVRDWADDYIEQREDAISRRAYEKGKQDIQNPSWSEDDGRIRQDIENLIYFSLRDGSAVSPAADTTKEDAISWIQSLKERVQPQNK